MPENTVTITRSRVKNLNINGYCELCKKANSWNGTLVMGSALEEGTQEVPETCTCQFNVNAAAIVPIASGTTIWNSNPVSSNNVNSIMVSKQQYTAIIAENEQLRARIAELEKRAIHNAVDDLFLADEASHE